MPKRPPIHRPSAQAGRRKAYDKAKGTTAERGYGARHKRWRMRVLARDNHLCQHCLQRDKLTVARVADHIVPHQPPHHGAKYDLANGQALCLACHAAKTNRERTGGGGVASLQPEPPVTPAESKKPRSKTLGQEFPDG